MGNRATNAVDPAGLFTIAGGYGFDISFFLVHFSVSVDLTLQFNPFGQNYTSWHLGPTWNYGPGIGLGANAGPQVTVTTAPSATDVAGPSGGPGIWGANGNGIGAQLIEFGAPSDPYYGLAFALPFFPCGAGLGGGVFYNNGMTATWGSGQFFIPNHLMQYQAWAWVMQQAMMQQAMMQQAMMQQASWMQYAWNWFFGSSETTQTEATSS